MIFSDALILFQTHYHGNIKYNIRAIIKTDNGGLFLMGVQDLNYLIAVYEEGSISKAADRLFMAQSSLSQFLSTLEHELNTKLFIRTSRGVRPTESGRIAIEYAYKRLSDYHKLRDEIQDTENLKTGRVIMGVSTFRGTFLMPPVLREFKKLYPNVHVIIIEENSLMLEQMLQNGYIDLAIIVLPAEILKADVESLMRDEICIITNAEHPVMKFAKPVKLSKHNKNSISKYVNLLDTVNFEYVLSDYDTILGRESRKIFKEHNIIPKVYNDKLSAFFAASMGAAGLGLAFTYSCARYAYPEAEFLSLGHDGKILELGVSLAPGRYHSKASIVLKEILLNVLSD